MRFDIHLTFRATKRKAEFADRLRRQMTPAERVIWPHLRSMSKKKFSSVPFWRAQVVVRGFIVDFFDDTHQLAVEIDGATHDPSLDAKRDAILASIGIRTLRFTNRCVVDSLQDVLALIESEMTGHVYTVEA